MRPRTLAEMGVYRLGSKQAVLLGWGLVAGGTLALMFGVGWGVRSLALQFGSSERVMGTIVEFRTSHSRSGATGESGVTHIPVVQYEVDDQKYTIEGVGSSGFLRRRRGDKLPVIYRAETPADGHLNTFLDRWAFPLFFGVLGGIFATLGRFMVRAQRKRG